MNTIRYAIILAAMIPALTLQLEAESNVSQIPSDDAASIQTMCPVLTDNPVNKDIYIDYKGKRVYFCCTMCRKKFQDNPEKYLSALPQFKTHEKYADHNDAKESDEHSDATIMGIKTHELIAPLGIATLSALTMTLLAGLFRKKLGRRFLRIHKALAFTAITLAVLHALLVMSMG